VAIQKKGKGKKSCEIKGGGQEMAVMVGLWQKFYMNCVIIKIFAINLPSQPFLGRHL